MRNYGTSGTAVVARDTVGKRKALMVRVTEMAASMLNKRERRTDE